MSEIVDVDYLILGSGVSGLYAALQLAEHGDVLVVTKEKASDSNTAYAQGGVASVLANTDSFEKHIADTLEAGAGLCNPAAVEALVREGPGHVRRLMELGARFQTTATGELDLGREGGHSVNRIVHAADLTGREIQRTLEESVRRSRIRLLEYHAAVELITNYHLTKFGNGPLQCFGAYIYDRRTWDIFVVRARAVILTTGGAGQVYLHNTNPVVSTGDGVALGYRAGAVISNMEFFQFHPTAIVSPGGNTFLISEALRGFGARLLGANKEPFMQRYDERQELAPRDIVARAIDSELKRTGARQVWLDARHKSRADLLEHFPTIFAYCLKQGIDISKDLIPVVPAAHYMCGGVRTDIDGRTNLPGLFAAGETACTGVHGGNRLASNSLLEGLVFADRIARQLIKEKSTPRDFPRVRDWNKEGLVNAEEWILVQYNYEEVKKVMWNLVGIVRSNLRLDRALRRIKLLHEEVRDFYRRTIIQNRILELRNITLVARLIVESALMRKESRGLHYNTDYAESREPSDVFTDLRRTE